MRASRRDRGVSVETEAFCFQEAEWGYHAAGPSEKRSCVIEVWESQEMLDRFFLDKLAPALQNVNIDVQQRTIQVVNVLKP